MSWRDQLQPASFRGVPFFVEARPLTVGRRKATSEFPGSDKGYTEDLGRRQKRIAINGYLVGDDYMSNRDALVAAVEKDGTAGTLVDPWLGRIQVQAEALTVTEKKDHGGYCAISLTLIEEGQAPAPAASADTSSTILGLTPGTFALIETAFAVAFSTNNLGALAAGFGIAILGDVAGRILGLAGIPASYLGGVGAIVAEMFADPGLSAADPAGAALTICSALDAYGSAVVLYQRDVSVGVAPAYSSSAVAIQNDPTGGLQSFANQFATDYAILPPAITPDRIAEGVNQQAVVDLVNGAVAVTVAEILAQSDFDSADSADAARDQVIALFDAPVDRAADTAADDLYAGLTETRAAALADIAARGSALQPLVNWSTPMPRTALDLALLLYPDFGAPGGGTVAASIDAAASDLLVRNAAIHPAFMPISGTALAA